MDHADGGIAGACAEYDDDVGRCTVYASICRAYTLDGREYAPERVAYNKQRHVLLVRTAQDIVCLFLDHVTIGDDDLFLVERLLSYLVVS